MLRIKEKHLLVSLSPKCFTLKITMTNDYKKCIKWTGPKEKVSEFVYELKQEDIFAKEVDSSGVAFHSPVMAPIGPPLLVKLKRVFCLCFFTNI